MWLPVALAAWGHVLLHSTSYQVYTCHIPRVYLVYANINVIYQVYAWYILMAVYIRYITASTWYIPCINLSYDNVKYIPDIHHEKLSETFWHLSRDSLDMVYTKIIPSLYLVYCGSKLSRDRYRNVSESFSWCMSGIYFTLSHRFMHGIYQVYT